MMIDVHGHIGRVSRDRKEFIDVINLIAKMDAWGIDKTCILPLTEHPEGCYLECSTEDVIAACAQRPDRLIPFCLIDPRLGNQPEPDFTWLLEEYRARGCRGVGEFLPKMQVDDERCIRLYKQAGKLGMPVLFDMQDSQYSYGLRDTLGLPGMERALQQCPETVFIGHGPTFWAEISGAAPPEERAGYPKGPVKPDGAVPRLMRKYHNMWADTSAGSGYNALMRDPEFGVEFVNEFQNKLLFGTDSCQRSDVNSMRCNVSYLNDLRSSGKLTDEAYNKIAWKNCVRLLGL